MAKYKLYAIFVFLVAAGLSAAFLVSQGYYPIALVGGDFISERKFALDYSAATLYYQNFLKTYGTTAIGGKIAPLDLELIIMNQLIDDDLVKVGARREVGSDLNYLIENKINKYKDDAKLSGAAAALYGFDKNNFVSEVLIPRAMRDVLSGRLFLRGEKIGDWLAAERKTARVIIFSPKFKWNGEEVTRTHLKGTF